MITPFEWCQFLLHTKSCVCMCLCVCMCVRARVCVCVCVYMHMGVLQIIQLLQESQTL